MSKLKVIFLVFFITFSLSEAMGQDPFRLQINKLKKQYSVPKLSKAQMYADFDTLISIMERCNPQYLIRKAVTGYDMIAEMKTQRNLIEKCNNVLKFTELLNNTLFLSLDEHCNIGHDVWWFRYGFYQNDVRINNITDKDFGINFHYEDYVFGKAEDKALYLIYAQGKYFLKNKIVFYYKSHSLELPLGTEIVSFNDEPLSMHLNSNKTIGSRWDYNKKVYYHSTLYFLNSINRIGYYKDNKFEEFQFKKFFQKEEEWNPDPELLIHWFEKDSILYFRMPVMQTIDIQKYIKFQEMFPEENITIPEWKLNFENNVLKYCSFPVKSIIIDIRGNEGGSDLAWRQLLGMIYKTTLEYPFCLLTSTANEAVERLQPTEERLIPKEEYQKRIFEYIDAHYPFRVLEEGSDSIKNNQQNLGYEGTIYLLIDEDIYSSAGALTSLCSKTDKIKTVGMPTGKILGQGATPSVFVLPHSRLIFTLDLTLDASTVSKAEDFYHDHIDYPVTPSIDYYKYWYDPARPYAIDEKAMYEYDEVFLKAIEIIKAQK